MLAEIAMRKLHRATISRAVKGESSISEQTLLRISLGLQLDEDTYRWLEDLRKEEPYVNHSSQTPAIINPDGEQLPSWMFNN
jgi:plasmid maintenance system antidote protein VapI